MKKMYGTLIRHWWWDGMYKDTISFARNCPDCAIVTGGGRKPRPPLHPIPVSRPFQIIGMELPQTQARYLYVVVIQDYLTKWPFIFPMPDQKSQRSFFHKSHLPLQKWLVLMYWWAQEYPVSDAAMEAEVRR